METISEVEVINNMEEQFKQPLPCSFSDTPERCAGKEGPHSADVTVLWSCGDAINYCAAAAKYMIGWPGQIYCGVCMTSDIRFVTSAPI